MGLSKRFKRALDRENIAISLNQSRNKRVIRKAFEQSEGNTITDRIVSLVDKGLRAERKDDRTYREDKPENWKDHLKEGESMTTTEGNLRTKGALRDFILEHFDDVSQDKVEGKSKAYLQGLLSIKLSDLGVDIALNEMQEIDLNYIVGLIEGSDRKADAARLVNDGRGSSRRDEIERLREQRLQIGEDRDDKDVEQLREERLKLYDGLDKRVEKLVEDKVEQGKDEVEALREARFEIFQEDE